MPKRSAGILMYQGSGTELRLLLVHPGGPFWAKKDLGTWSIPKGEYAEGDDPLTARSGNLPKNWAASRSANSSIWVNWCSRAARSSALGRCDAHSMLLH